MILEWKSYGDHGRTSKGSHGTWRIVTNGEWWFLTVQPHFTRGMLSRGEFEDRQQAMDFAQKCENDTPIQPQQIECTER